MSGISCSLIHGDPILEIRSCDPIQELVSGAPVQQIAITTGSLLSVFNGALSRLGEKLLSSEDEDSIRGNTLRSVWDRVRRSVLRDHPWQSVQKRVRVTDLSGCDDATEFSFSLSECALRVLDVGPVNGGNVKWSVRGRTLVSTVSDIYVLLVYDINDPSLFESQLFDALTAKLAFEVSSTLTRDRGLQESMEAEYRRVLMDAQHTDSTEHSPDDYRVDIGQGEAARYGHGYGPNYNDGYDPLRF